MINYILKNLMCIFLTFIYRMYVCMCTGMGEAHISLCWCGLQKRTCRMPFSPSFLHMGPVLKLKL